MSILHRFCTYTGHRKVVQWISAILLISALGQPSSGFAQTGQDGGMWFSANTQGTLGDGCKHQPGWRWWFDGHLRYLDDSGGYNQSIMRPALGYAINSNTALW